VYLKKRKEAAVSCFTYDPGNARVNFKIRSAVEESRDADPAAYDVCIWGVCTVCMLGQRNCSTCRNSKDLFLSRAERCT